VHVLTTSPNVTQILDRYSRSYSTLFPDARTWRAGLHHLARMHAHARRGAAVLRGLLPRDRAGRGGGGGHRSTSAMSCRRSASALSAQTQSTFQSARAYRNVRNTRVLARARALRAFGSHDSAELGEARAAVELLLCCCLAGHALCSVAIKAPRSEQPPDDGRVRRSDTILPAQGGAARTELALVDHGKRAERAHARHAARGQLPAAQLDDVQRVVVALVPRARAGLSAGPVLV
jgi:hypothetical protein